MNRKTSDTNSILNPVLERLDPIKLRLLVEQPRLRKQLHYVMAKSPFYRRKFKAFGRGAGSLLRRFKELPFSGKSDLVADQSEHPPYGSNLCVNPREVRRVHKTSGTTMRPLLIAMTAADIEATVASGARSFRAAGLGRGYTVAHCLNYCMWMGGYTDHQSLEATGAAVVPYGVGNSRALVETIRDLRINAIHCTPSYLTVLEDLLATEFQMQPQELGLKLGLFGAESGMEDSEFRSSIEMRWGIKAMNANYGMADVLSIFGGECRVRDGLHFMGQGNVMVELIDPLTLDLLPVESGAEGELVLTNINRQAQPMVRYRTGDMVRINSHNRCRCGRGSFRFSVKGRSDEMLVVRGVNVFPSAVRMALMRFSDRVTAQFQIMVETPPPLQTIMIKAEHRGRPDPAALAGLTGLMREHFRSELGVRPKIELVPEGTLPRTDGKTRLVVRNYVNR